MLCHQHQQQQERAALANRDMGHAPPVDRTFPQAILLEMAVMQQPV
jgi:hypothetical protein